VRRLERPRCNFLFTLRATDLKLHWGLAETFNFTPVGGLATGNSVPKNRGIESSCLAGWLALWLRPTRLLRSAIVLKPSTLLGLHQAMCKQKYRMLFSPNRRRKPGPKGPSAELVHAVVEMKRRNTRWGCPRIAEQIALAFNLPIDKDVVRRILAHHHGTGRGTAGPSWLTFLGHTKDSLWSMDLFRCESVTLRTHWVLVVMDQYTRLIIGFGVHAGSVDGVALCRMFNRAIRGQRWLPKYLSSDHDPLYKCHQWQAHLRILKVTEIKTVPYVPLSHPFVERLIGTIRREYLDHMSFWTSADLENKLLGSSSKLRFQVAFQIVPGATDRVLHPIHESEMALFSERMQGGVCSESA
jgi:putative transposase